MPKKNILESLRNSYDYIEWPKAGIVLIYDLLLVLLGIFLLIMRTFFYSNQGGDSAFIYYLTIITAGIVLPAISLLLIIKKQKLLLASLLTYIPTAIMFLFVMMISGGIQSFIIPSLIFSSASAFLVFDKRFASIFNIIIIITILITYFFKLHVLLEHLYVTDAYITDIYKIINIISVIALSGFAFLIMQRKQHKLHYSENLIKKKVIERTSELNSIFQAYSDMLVRVDYDGTVTAYYSNKDINKIIPIDSNNNLINSLPSRIKDYFKENLRNSLNEDNLNIFRFSFEYRDDTKFFETRIVPVNKDEAVCIFRDVTILNKTERKVVDSIKENEILLKEVHHRVKNNMQLIVSLISLEMNYLNNQDLISIFRDTQDRIRTMGFVHTIIYKSEKFNEVDFKTYVEMLVSNLLMLYDKDSKITPEIDIPENLLLIIDYAIPSGLIINETINNSLRHAFKNQSEGKIKVSFRRHHNEYLLSVIDNGSGIDSKLIKDIDNDETKSMGLELINILVEQLSGTVYIDNNNGTSFNICWKHTKRVCL